MVFSDDGKETLSLCNQVDSTLVVTIAHGRWRLMGGWASLSLIVTHTIFLFIVDSHVTRISWRSVHCNVRTLGLIVLNRESKKSPVKTGSKTQLTCRQMNE